MLLMRDDVPEINSAEVISDVGDETVAVAADVEDHFGGSDEIGARKVPPHVQMLRDCASTASPSSMRPGRGAYLRRSTHGDSSTEQTVAKVGNRREKSDNSDETVLSRNATMTSHSRGAI